MSFHSVEANLRASFRVLAVDRPGGDVVELPGISIASLGARFQMFNAAFLNSAATQPEFERRVESAREHFQSRALQWSLWICEDWLDRATRRQLSRICHRYGLRFSSEMPGMMATEMGRSTRSLPPLEFRAVDSVRTLEDFRGIGSVCFHVPIEWFNEVFDESLPASRPEFRCWVAYLDGAPVATAASVPTRDSVGLYNIATAPGYRGRGFAEAITRHAVMEERRAARGQPLVLQSTPQGLHLYERLGFQAVTRIFVYNSVR